MNRHSAKRRREDDNGSAIAIDRLTQLPQPILHHILSLLSQRDAVRTSVLSKSWRYLWHGRFNVEFRDDDLCLNKKKKKRKFWSFVDKTLQRYLDQNLSLQKFFFDIECEVDFELLHKWIPVLIMNMGLRSLSLIFDWNHNSTIDFPLPLVVFQSESLVELHLQWCNLNTLKPTDCVMLNNLQTLRLHYVDITDEIFEKIISGCPLIENLDLSCCAFLETIKLHKHHNIKDFGSSGNGLIEIENTHTLESVRIQNFSRGWFLPLKKMHFPHLKSLDLYKVQLPADIFDNFSSFFPCLNELILNGCKGLKEFRLLSSSIKRLTIVMGTRNRIKAFIDTPNILYFEYSDNGYLPSIKFGTTSNEWKSEISLWYKLSRSNKDAKAWFLKVNKLLKALSQSHITLVFNPSKYKKLHINDSHGGFYKPVIVKHLKLWECFPSSSDSAILNCLFRICRPRYIHMDLYDDDTYMDLYDDDSDMDMDDDLRAKCKKINNLAGFMSKTVPNEIGCCFWLKDLEEVGIEVRDKEAKEWHCVEGTSLLALSFQQRVRFRLTWTEQISRC